MNSFIDKIMNTQIWQDKSVGDILTLEAMVSVLSSVLSAIAILIIGWFVAGWLKRRIERIGGRNAHLDKTLFEFLGDLVRYTVLAFTVIFVLNTFGVKTTSIVALIGAAGLAIGLALQGTLSNIAAGVMIIFFRPIRIGDFVEVNGQMGTVKEIALNFTELTSLGNVQIIVPNSDVWGNTIVNYSGYPTRRAEWSFGVGYGANLKTAEEVIRNVVMSDGRTLADEGLFLQVNNLGDSSVDFLCRAWVNADDYFQYQADIKRQVKEALDDAGVDIPFPTRTIVKASPDDWEGSVARRSAPQADKGESREAPQGKEGDGD